MNLKIIWFNNGFNVFGGYYNGDVIDILLLVGLIKLIVLNI